MCLSSIYLLPLAQSTTAIGRLMLNYSKTFIELLFIKGKSELYYKLINIDKIVNQYTKSDLVFAGLPEANV